MTSVHSIDNAANGYIRHRFVRAFGASYLVVFVFGIVAAMIGGAISVLISGNLAQIATLPLGLALALGLFMLPLLLAVGLLGALGDVLHRRFTGGALFAFGLYVVVIAGGGAIASGLALAGIHMDLPVSDAPWLAFVGLVGGAIGYQMLRHGWWQMRTSREHFFAVRGWRPPPWQVLTTLRRQLGLPAFLSYVGKKRLAASVLYFGVAVLNVGLIALLILPMLFGSMTPEDNVVMTAATLTIMFGLLAANIFGAGNLVARHADTRATALYQSVREWDTRAPIVFLRAFNQDDDRVAAVGGDAFARWPAGVGRSRTLDELLLEHGSPYGPVIAIGDPRDPTPPLGAARVFVRERGNGWQDVVRGLVSASKCVVMCPNTGAGVQWELDLIAKSRDTLRVIFLASPELTRADTLALFARLVPDMPHIAETQTPVAAYAEQGVWRVVTAKQLSIGSYTAALNTSLQAMFGLDGVKMKARASEAAEAALAPQAVKSAA